MRTSLRRIALAFLGCVLLDLSPLIGVEALDAPATPNAAPAVRQLMQLLDAVSGHYILSGQQELAWDPARVEEDIGYIEKTTGKLPVVRGFDFGDYTTDDTAPTRHHATDRAIAWFRRGGIVTFSCHMAMVTGSPSGTAKFYTKETNFDVRQAVVDGTPENRELIAKLDVVANELKTLQRARVVVIWRPWHECAGGWFWWGAHGPEPYKRLWQITFERFTRRHHLDNLIWCYNPTDAPGALRTWYPGPDTVDMVGLDFYSHRPTFLGLVPAPHRTFVDEYRALKNLTDGRKVIAMTENGPIPDPDELFTAGAHWAYFLTWNQFENNPAQNSVAFLNKVYHHPKVLTLDNYAAAVKALMTAQAYP